MSHSSNLQLNDVQRKHLGGEPPIYPFYPIDKSYELKNRYTENRYLASPSLALMKYSSQSIPPLEIVHLPFFEFDSEEFRQLYSSYSFEDSCKLFELYQLYNGNFIILADRLGKSVVDVQQWYFEIHNGILRQRRQPIPHPIFDLEKEIKRRAHIEYLMKESDHEEEQNLSISYYSLKDKYFLPNGFKKLPETEVSEMLPQGLPGSHKYVNRGSSLNNSKELKERENKHELIRKQGIHLVTSLIPIPKQNILQKAHDVMIEILTQKGQRKSKLAESLYPPNLAKSGGLGMPTMPLLSKYLKVRLLAIKLADHRRKNK
eukprot:NODE_859_length_3643_cov_0.232223.p1 type:complete len:317 gc:universal NODE_859_length_3643_cov_0.232223:1783-833(-)